MRRRTGKIGRPSGMQLRQPSMTRYPHKAVKVEAQKVEVIRQGKHINGIWASEKGYSQPRFFFNEKDVNAKNIKNPTFITYKGKKFVS